MNKLEKINAQYRTSGNLPAINYSGAFEEALIWRFPEIRQKYDDLIEAGDYANARAKGKIISAGKDYVMQDGDIVVFKFNV